MNLNDPNEVRAHMLESERRLSMIDLLIRQSQAATGALAEERKAEHKLLMRLRSRLADSTPRDGAA